MECNIDAKGKVVRLIWGLIMLAAAALISGLILADVIAAGWVWAVVVGLVLMGVFGLYEARAGWCAVRAMGFKTKW